LLGVYVEHPATGRFLTRDANPNSPNPYVPFDPTGLLIGPLGLMGVFYAGRKSKKSAPYMLMLMMLVILPLTVGLACGGGGTPVATTPTTTPIVPVATTPISSGAGSSTSIATVAPQAPVVIATPCPPPTLTTGDGVSNRLPYGGNEVMALYNKMKDYTDGWWHKYPGISFSFEVFTGLMIYHEGASGGEVTERLVAEASSQQLYVGNSDRPAYCSQGQCSENAVANYWAATSGSVWELVKYYIRENHDISEYTAYGGHGISKTDLVKTVKALGDRALHPTELNYNADNALSKYGNDRTWVEKIVSYNRIFAEKEYRDGSPQNVYYFLSTTNGSAIYYSKNQEIWWAAQPFNKQ